MEYAGDYLKQEPFNATTYNPDHPPGAVIDAKSYVLPSSGAEQAGETDGEIDYIIDTSADPNDPPGDPTTWVKRVRWYGLPRDINGDGAVTINDVVPLTDVMGYYFGSAAAPGKTFNPAGAAPNDFPFAPWEKSWPTPNLRAAGLTDSNIPKRVKEQYSQQNYANFPNNSAQAFSYVCAWHNDAPPLIRILVKIDDPNGRLQDGQWYEYIFSR